MSSHELERFAFDTSVDGSSKHVIPTDNKTVTFEMADGIAWAVFRRRTELDGRPCFDCRRIPLQRMEYHRFIEWLDAPAPVAAAEPKAKPKAA